MRFRLPKLGNSLLFGVVVSRKCAGRPRDRLAPFRLDEPLHPPTSQNGKAVGESAAHGPANDAGPWHGLEPVATSAGAGCA